MDSISYFSDKTGEVHSYDVGLALTDEYLKVFDEDFENYWKPYIGAPQNVNTVDDANMAVAYLCGLSRWTRQIRILKEDKSYK